jgi:hypothetical protein
VEPVPEQPAPSQVVPADLTVDAAPAAGAPASRLEQHEDGRIRWRWSGQPDPDGGPRFSLSVYPATPNGHVEVGVGLDICRLLPEYAREIAAALLAQADAADQQSKENPDA